MSRANRTTPVPSRNVQPRACGPTPGLPWVPLLDELREGTSESARLVGTSRQHTMSESPCPS
eukprot:scaffold243552_cov32-Tisochrysis_lutea.AAC.5